MRKLICCLSLGVLLLAACATTGRKTQSPEKSDPSVSAARSATMPDPELVARLDVAVDSTEALYAFGDIADFLVARDSLRTTVGELVASYPAILFDPYFKHVMRNLADLDSMFAIQPKSHEHLQETDSLALAVQEWPENGRTPIRFSTNGDTLFPMMESDRIEFWVRYFTGPGRERFERYLYRMQLYRPLVEQILDELQMPRELICVAIIESGFYLTAKSSARAVGPWQFISGTARIYGLRVDWWYDERRDIVASTYAAGNYLKDLYGIWNDWPLALAAYNCGEYRVARAVASQRTSDFWKLRLPKQTERYVPKFLATLYILRDPASYGFTIPDVEPIRFDQVTVKDATDIKLIAEAASTTVDVLRELNPSLLQWATPPKMEIKVKVPVGSGDSCAVALANLPPEERMTWRKHRVQTGQTMSSIAAQYGTSVSALQRLNGINNAHRISAGSYLVVPMQGGGGGEITAASTDPSGTSTPQYTRKRRNLDKNTLESYAARYAPPANHKRIVYVVKHGNTLGEIAEKFNTSAGRLREWNNLSHRSYIYPGQKLTVYVPESFEVAEVSQESPVITAQPDESDYDVQTYTVRQGDSMYSISQRYNVKMVDLLSWNNKSMQSKLYPGQVIEIWQKK
jgi:membrane-bound lytic murein transglycosylase D